MTCLINIWESKEISQMLDTTDKDSEVSTIMNELVNKRKQRRAKTAIRQSVRPFLCLLFNIRVRPSCSHMSKRTGSKWKLLFVNNVSSRSRCNMHPSPLKLFTKTKIKDIQLRFLEVPLSFVPNAQNHLAPMFPRKT